LFDVLRLYENERHKEAMQAFEKALKYPKQKDRNRLQNKEL